MERNHETLTQHTMRVLEDLDALAACPTCHGDGEIMINLSPNNDPQATDYARCPDCHGTGAR